MKKIIIPAIAIIILIIGVVCFNFDEKAPDSKLTHGIDCLAAQTDMIVSGRIGNELVFSAEKFQSNLCFEDFKKITVTSIPDESLGILKLGSKKVEIGEIIEKESISSLVFSPANEIITEASFEFICDNYAGGASLECIMKFTEKENAAPTAATAAITVNAKKNISVYGELTSSDPENDELEYFIVSYPEKGLLTVTSKYGDFKYEPNEDYTGKDSFSYIVRDTYGNFSGISTVSITVTKSGIDLEYLDLKETSAHTAAIELAERGIMIGEMKAEGMYFNPEKSVSRQDFTVMLMKSAGIEADESLTETYFDDNSAIDERNISYIATAQKMGYICGSFDGKELNFRPEDAITRAEASLIISRMLNLTAPVSSIGFDDKDSIPIWAEESIASVYAEGIFSRPNPNEMTISATSALTRAQAAEAFYEIIQNR